MNTEFFSVQLNHIARDDLFALACFHHAVDEHPAFADKSFGGTPIVSQTLEFKDFEQFNRLFG